MLYKCPIKGCNKSFEKKLACDGHVRMSNDIQHIKYRQQMIINTNNQISQQQSKQSPVSKVESAYPQQVLVKAEELVEEEKQLFGEVKALKKEKLRQKIITEYYNNTILPKFQNNEWFTLEQYNALKRVHASEIEDLETMYEKIINDMKVELQSIRQQVYIDTKDEWRYIPCSYCGVHIPVEIAQQYGIPCPECYKRMVYRVNTIGSNFV